MAKYIKKSFAPHIYQDWIHLFKQCSPDQRSELLLAITDYPNHKPTIDIAIWDFIKSQLDAQYQKTENKSQTMSDNRNKGRPKSTEVDQSQPMTTEVDKCSQIEIEIKKETGIENKEKEISNDISKKITEETLFKAGFQNWVFPVEFRKLAVKHWSEETIREIEKQFSCREYDIETSINQLLESYPDEKTKKKVAEITNYGQYEYLHPQMDKWLNYKKSRGERYKTEQSLMVCAKKLHELSGGNALTADAIVEQSIASNYAGLFPLKQPTSNVPRISLKDMQELKKQAEIQKILNGES